MGRQREVLAEGGIQQGVAEVAFPLSRGEREAVSHGRDGVDPEVGSAVVGGHVLGKLYRGVNEVAMASLALQLILGFSGHSLANFERDAEQIRDRIGEMEEMGVDWTIVGAPWSPAPGPREWLQAFGETYAS